MRISSVEVSYRLYQVWPCIAHRWEVWPRELHGCLDNYINQERMKQKCFIEKNKKHCCSCVYVHFSYLRLALTLLIRNKEKKQIIFLYISFVVLPFIQHMHKSYQITDPAFAFLNTLRSWRWFLSKFLVALLNFALQILWIEATCL